MKHIFDVIQAFAFFALGIFGDCVYSSDTITRTVEQKQVTATFVLESDHIDYLTILDANGNVQVIETTDVHPFWVVTDEPDLGRAARSVVDENGVWLYHENVGPTENGYWVEAKDLREGDVFLGANGELSTLVASERVQFDETIRVYNFTVDGNHDYFVIAATDEYGQTCVLVHNAGLYDRPSGYRHGVRNQVYENAREASTGVARDPVTGRFIAKNGPWDMGHKPGYEFSKHQKSAQERGITREQFLNEHNDPSHYRPELPSSNRNHNGEAPPFVNLYES